MFHLLFESIVLGFLHKVSIDFNSNPFHPIALGGLNDDAAIAAPQIVNHIVAFHLSDLEHAVDDFRRCWNIRHFAVSPYGHGTASVTNQKNQIYYQPTHSLSLRCILSPAIESLNVLFIEYLLIIRQSPGKNWGSLMFEPRQ